jgi:hypothetical protein
MVIILRISVSDVFLLIIAARVSCTPSYSSGSREVRKGVLAENQTALAKEQWKNKCESFSSILQVSQYLLILEDRLPALAPLAIALRINLQTNVLILGHKSL